MLWKTVSAIMLTLLLTSMLTLAFNIQPAKAASETIIDTHGDSRFTKYPSGPYWWSVADHDAFHTRAYNNNFWYTYCGDAAHGGDLYFGMWTPSVIGEYEVFVWIPNPDPFGTYTPTHSANYQIWHSSGLTERVVNQALRLGGWYSLGSFTFDASSSIILNDRTGEPYISTMVAFDAIKFTQVVTLRTLTVSSAHDSPNPSNGGHSYSNGQSVTCSVSSPVTEGGTVWTCTGWSGTGSVPSSGSGTSVTFTITQDSTITWNWQGSVPQRTLTVSSAHDSPNPSNGQHTYNDGSSVTCSVSSPVVEGGVSYSCTGWSGTGSVPSSGSGTSVTFTITQASSITWNWIVTPPVPRTLTVYSSPSGVSFTANGVSHSTPWSGTYSQGTSVSLVMPSVYSAGDVRYYWHEWSDGEPSSSRTIILDADITVTGTYIGPYYELIVTSSPISEIPFTIDGASKTTTYSEWLYQGYYTIEMPTTHSGYVWQSWLEDGSTSRTRTVLLNTAVSLTAIYVIPSLPDFSITASPTSLTIQQGSSGSSIVTITSINGFNQPVQLSVSGAPSGVTATLSPSQVTPPAGGTATSTLTVSVATSATPGSYPLTVRGISGALTRNVDITVEITTVPQVTAAMDELLLNLIGQYANSYFNPAWDITIDQYKAWIATIASGEGGKGGYVAHSQGSLGSDVFNHRVVGTNFRFSTGIGPFQLDRGGEPDNWHYWPTIKKLNPEEAVRSVLGWHYRTFGAGVNLKYFADNSVWFAVKGGNAANHWGAVTGTSWDIHNKGKVSLDWLSIKNQLSQNAQGLEFRYETNVKDMGVMRWSIKESDGIKTDTGKKVIFDGDYQTWLITARNWNGIEVSQYYYTFDQSRGIEVWAWNNFQDPVNKFRYIFVREHTTGCFPEHRDTLLGVAGETLTSPAIVGDEVIAKSPVDLIVTDPEGLTITKNVSEVPGMFYNEFDLDGDGDLDDVVTILHRKLGNYSIWVVPEPEAIPTDTFTLVVSTQTQIIVLAENVAISEIPSEPYIFEYTSVLYTFSIVWGEETFVVSVESNSTVSNFAFNQPNKEIGFNVTGSVGTGFCNVTIPKALLYGEPWTVLIDDAPVPATITENATHSFLYFTYTHSTHKIQIIGTWVIGPPPPTYSLTITTTVGGTTDPAPGTYSYTASSTVEVTAIPEANYLLDYWELDSVNVGLVNPYAVLMDKNHTLKAVFSPVVPPLSASISPLSASILVGQSVTFTSTVSGGAPPYSYQWYLNGNPVSGATSNTWTFTSTTNGIYYVYLKVTDNTGNTTQSETARITVTTVPVGGYSLPIQLPTTAQPATLHIALLTILTAIFITIKRRTKRKH